MNVGARAALAIAGTGVATTVGKQVHDANDGALPKVGGALLSYGGFAAGVMTAAKPGGAAGLGSVAAVVSAAIGGTLLGSQLAKPDGGVIIAPGPLEGLLERSGIGKPISEGIQL